MPDYSRTQQLQAIAIVDEMESRGVGGGGSGGSNGSPTPLYQRVINAPDMSKTINYADAGTNDERITTVVVSSASVGLAFTDTYSYAGTAGNYRITSIVRSQS